MKILIDGQTLLTPDIKRGIGTYFRHTVENVLANDLSNDFYLNMQPGDHLAHLSPWAREKLCLIDIPNHDNHSPFQNGPDGLAKRYSDAVNNEIEKRGIDVYWSPNGLMDNVFLPEHKISSCRFAVTIFDLIVLVMAREYAKHLSASAMAAYKKKLSVLEEDYDLFFHISQHTQSDFTTRLRVGDKQHVVTPLAADSSFRPYPFPAVSAEKDYVVYTGGLDPRKNMDRALEAFAALHQRYSADQRIRNTELMVVCVMDDAARTRMLRRAGRLGLNGKVTFTGFIDDAALVELYQKARCLFFPSLYEGFGLPILEGLACGLPVAAANTSSLPEVGGEWALYFDPLNIEEMADSLYQALQPPMDLQSRLARYEYSKNFSWQKTARATLEAIEDSVDQARRKRVA